MCSQLERRRIDKAEAESRIKMGMQVGAGRLEGEGLVFKEFVASMSKLEACAQEEGCVFFEVMDRLVPASNTRSTVRSYLLTARDSPIRIPYVLMLEARITDVDNAINEAKEVNKCRKELEDRGPAKVTIPPVEAIECLRLATVDQYLKKKKKKDTPIYPNEKNPDEPPANKLRDFELYNLDDSKKNMHLREPLPPHPRRILLWAETQIGKTGAFCAFLLLLLDTLQAAHSLPQPLCKGPLDIGPVLRWVLPQWFSLTKDFKNFQYGSLKFAKYHMKVRAQRLSYFTGCWDEDGQAISDWRGYLVWEQIAKNECIRSKKGTDQLVRLVEKLEGTSEPPLKPAGAPGSGSYECTNPELLQAVLNWDGRKVWDPLSLDPRQSSLGFPRLIEVDSASNLITLPANPKTELDVYNLAWGEDGEKKSSAVADSDVSDVPLAPVRMRPVVHNFLAKRKLKEDIPRLSAKTVEITFGGVGGDAVIELPSTVWSASSPAKPAAEPPSLRRQNTISPRLCEKLFGGTTLAISVPSKMGNLFETQTSNWTIAAEHREKRWVFTPSFARAGHAVLDRSETMDEGCVQVLVVRQRDYAFYRAQWGDVYVVVQLPDEITLGASDVMDNKDLNASVEDGVGFARLFIQLFAYAMGLEYVWMLDDNVHATWRLDIEALCEEQAHTKLPEPCRFADAMDYIYSLVDYGGNTTVDLPGRPNVPLATACRDASSDPNLSKVSTKFNPKQVLIDPDPDQSLRESRTKASSMRLLGPHETVERKAFMGGKNRFGLIGMGRDPDKYQEIITPFSASPRHAFDSKRRRRIPLPPPALTPVTAHAALTRLL